jgi:hypothetical protein
METEQVGFEQLSSLFEFHILMKRDMFGKLPLRVLRSWVQIPPSYPVTVLYGGRDIYGSGTQVVYSRFPEAQKILLENSGHIPWLQDKERFTEILEHTS